jgi:hypothetical protein
MIESTLPRWSVRLDAKRPHGFSDLVPMVATHLRAHEAAQKFLGPYNARQRAQKHYMAPDATLLREMIRQGAMNDFSYAALINSLIRFCEQTKGQRGLPEPHPSTIHSIQLPQPAFEIRNGEGGDTIVSIIGIKEPLIVRGLRDASEVRFIIVRPKLSQLGTASASNWEVLFFRQAHGYIPEWVDSSLNPRWSGKF